MKSSLESYLSKYRYIFSILIIIVTLTALTLTLMPAEDLGHSGLWSYDKLGHLSIFLSWTFALGLYLRFNRSAKLRLWMIFLSGAIFGAIIEILQYITPFLHRDGDVMDLVFDVIGSLIAVGLLKLLFKKTK